MTHARDGRWDLRSALRGGVDSAAEPPPLAPSTTAERLDHLRAITDTALNGADLDELLAEVLDRVRAILDADTVAVLLLEEGGEYLYARAARGLEEEVYQGVRLPVGTGFAGSIAARGKPMTISRVDPETVANPILWEKGIRAMLGAPMQRGEQVIGVLHVGRLQDRPFSQDDVQLLLVAADRVAGAVTAQQLSAETAAAEVLERSLLPGRFPRLPGLELAGRYVPAAQRAVGGDWYDAFALPDGTLWLVIGDVVGHGLRSAVVMGRVRSTLRAYTLLGGGPAEVLELTDRKVHHFEIGSMITVLCAVSRPPYDRFEIATAGHPAPVLSVPGDPAMLVDVLIDPPLGTVAGQVRSSVTIDMPLGGVLLLYTDGLVENGYSAIGEGMDRLREMVQAEHPEVVCRTVMSRMIGSSQPTDDVAVLVTRRTAG